MATVTQTVIIDFQANYDSLQAGIDILKDTGKVEADLAAQFKKTNTEVKKQGDELTTAARKVQNNTQSFGRLSELMKQFPKSGVNRFLLQIGQELSKAGVSADLFFKKAKEGNDLILPKFDSLKLQLAAVKKRMEEAAKTSGVLSKEYLALKEQAGALSAAIRDINSDIANTGSDTKNIDNVVGSISALAGGYSALQGITALFGDESEDLQKALLKVNAAMALATGLQQVMNATTKTGSLTRLADAAATGLQSAAQTIYTFVTGRATAATLLFKAALLTTGIGAVVLLVIALSNAFRRSNKDLEDATELSERYNRELESMNTLLEQNLQISLARAEQAGAAESQLIAIRGRSLLQQRQGIVEANRDLAKQRDALNGTSAAYGKLNTAIEENNKALKDLDTQIVVAGINQQKALADERKRASDDAVAKAKEAGEKALENAKRQRALEFADYQAGIELKLLAADQGSREELDLQKSLLRAKLLIDLEAEGLSLNQRKLLIRQFFKDRLELEKGFNRAVVASAIEDQKNRDAAALENLNLTESEKLELRIEYLRLGAAQEVISAEGNAAKILAINAKLNSDITAAKVESIKKQADFEVALFSAQGGAAKRALEGVVSNEQMKSEVRGNALRNLLAIEMFVIDRQITANRNAAAIQGSDQAALALEYAQLLDAKAAKAEETEKKITGIVEDENAKRQASDISYIQATVAGLLQIGDIIAGIQSHEQEAADQAIKRKREEVDELLEAGAITEKEARERTRRLEIEERQTKQRAAQQQKNLAIFQALLAIPQAYITGLTAPFPIGGPIYGAILAGIAASQAAIVASRPIPKFATGKKGSYSGIGEVGEAGAELIQRADGSMEVATRRSMVYLGARDKVFTAAETRNILPYVNKEAMIGAKTETFDYVKLAKAMKQPGNSTVVNIDKEFISESVANGLRKVNYWDKTYSSK